MRRLAICCVMMAACGPEAPQDSTAATDPGGTSATSTEAGTEASTSTGTEGPTSTTADASMTTEGAMSSSTGPMPATTTIGDSSSSGESTESEGGTTGEPAPCCVAPAAPTSSVQADTPVGARALPWAVYGVSGGECGGSRYLYLYPETSAFGTGYAGMDNVEYVQISISIWAGMWPDDFVGTGPAWVRAHFDGQEAEIEGEITIHEYVGFPEEPSWCDPEELPLMSDALISFTIDLKADGWDLAGEVVASYCPELNQLCP